MSLFGKVFGGVASPATTAIEAVGNVVDKLFTSDEEKLDKQIILQRLAQQPTLAQVELNKVEATHRSLFVAGWRPYIGWIAGTSIGLYYIPQFIVAASAWTMVVWQIVQEQGATALLHGLPPYPADPSALFELVIAMLGMGTLRTFEKVTKVSK